MSGSCCGGSFWSLSLKSCTAAVTVGLMAAKLAQPKKRSDVVAFMHPVAKDGGGGERVLWCAMRSVMKARPEATIVLFTDLPPRESLSVATFGSESGSSSSVSGEEEEEAALEEEEEEEFWANYVEERAKAKFGVALPSKVKVVELKRTAVLDPARYPRFTLILQSLSSLVVGAEALYKLVPGVYIDTCGVPFVLPLARFFGCKTACYVHYPVISTDMLQRVKDRRQMYNNRSTGLLQSHLKRCYYKLFALMYGCVGSFAQVCMTNSSWTRAHIEKIWWKYWWTNPRGLATEGSADAEKAGDGGGGGGGDRDDGGDGDGVGAGLWQPLRVFPPCNTEELAQIPLKGPKRNAKKPVIVSIGQFRPEKAHEVQLEAYALALKQAEGSPATLKSVLQSRLVMVGGCRNEGDMRRVESLKRRAEELDISANVEFHVNVPFSQIKDFLSQALVGIHTMVDEHFGIGVVEYMAAGVVALANNSGGPASDIIVPFKDERTGSLQATGYLASTTDEYASALVNALCISDKEREKMCTAARRSIERFSESSFDAAFANALNGIV